MHNQFTTLCQEATLYKAWKDVKSKGSAGGIDGITIEGFDKVKVHQIKQIQEELKNGTWKPQPYLQIAIPKNKNPKEKRVLGMAAIKDKIVQQAIRLIIEPRFERLFLPNSYAYRHTISEYVQEAYKACHQKRRLGKHIPYMHRVLCSHRIYSSG